MDQSVDRAYRAREFAEFAGVTVRALHHYDRLGLLKPKRANSGYRIYRAADLERLEQIVALKFIGLPLKQIKVFLDRDAPSLSQALRSQRAALEEKRRLLDCAIEAIGQAERELASGRKPNAAPIQRIIEVIEMQDNTAWAEKYYTPEARAKVEQGKARWSPELQERVSRDWTKLFQDVEAALHTDPASPEAQALAARWKALVEEFTGGDPQVGSGLNALNRDRANWPDSARQQMAAYSNPEVWAFIQKAMAARSSG